MKRIALVVGITLATATPATADIAHRITSSVALTVDAAASNATRVPSVYSVSGTNVTPSDGTTSGRIGGLGALSSGTAVGYSPTEATITTSGDAFSFSESFIEGDDVGTSTSVSSGVAASSRPGATRSPRRAVWLDLSRAPWPATTRCQSRQAGPAPRPRLRHRCR